jgi:SOS-response transcriptional repressor LexA
LDVIRASKVQDKGTRLVEELMRFKPEGLTANAWAVRAGISRNFWNDLKRHGNPSRRTLEKLLAAAESSLAEFEALRVGDVRQSIEPLDSFAGLADARSAGWRGVPLAPIPVLETRLAGEWGKAGSGIEVMGLHLDSVRMSVTRPTSMTGDRHAYAVTVLGDAMWPRFRPGRHVLVSPAASVAIGDDVVLQLAASKSDDSWIKIMVKELVRRTATGIELRQFNPDLLFRVDTGQIAALHKVVGEAI